MCVCRSDRCPPLMPLSTSSSSACLFARDLWKRSINLMELAKQLLPKKKLQFLHVANWQSNPLQCALNLDKYIYSFHRTRAMRMANVIASSISGSSSPKLSVIHVNYRELEQTTRHSSAFVCVCVLHRVQSLTVVHLVSDDDDDEETARRLSLQSIDSKWQRQAANGQRSRRRRRATCAKQTNNPQTRQQQQQTNNWGSSNKNNNNLSSNVNFSLHFHLQALFTLFNVCFGAENKS